MSSRKNVKPWESEEIESSLNEICNDEIYFPKDITDSEEIALWFVFVSSKQTISEFRKILKKEPNVVFVDSEQLDLIEDDKSKTWDNTSFHVGMHVPLEEHDGPFCTGTRNIESQIQSGCEPKDSLDDNAEEMDMVWMKEGMRNRGASTCVTLRVPFVKMHMNGNLGKGASGECTRLTDKYSREAAVKRITKKDGPKALRQLNTMVKLMGNGLPQIFTIKERDQYYEIFMELIFPCISMTVLTKRLEYVMDRMVDLGRRFLHYLFYQLLGEISKFHQQKISHGDLGVSNNESNILLQKTKEHVLVVRLIDPSDINDRPDIDLTDISIHIRKISEICNDIQDSIFDEFRTGKIIKTKQEAADLRQQFSNLGEMFAKDLTYRKEIIDVLFDESKIEEVQPLGNIREMQISLPGWQSTKNRKKLLTTNTTNYITKENERESDDIRTVKKSNNGAPSLSTTKYVSDTHQNSAQVLQSEEEKAKNVAANGASSRIGSECERFSKDDLPCGNSGAAPKKTKAEGAFPEENNTDTSFIKVIASTDSIVDLTVDVIVSSEDSSIQSGGIVAKIIAEKGGHLLDECKDCLRKMYPYILNWSFQPTPSTGKLKCKHIFHAVVPKFPRQWQPYWEDGFESLLFDIFLRTERMGYESIALPVIGTGKGGAPIDFVIDLICANIEKFAVTKTSINGLQTVMVVHPDKRVVHTIEEKVKKFEKFFIQTPAGPVCNIVYCKLTGNQPDGIMIECFTKDIHLTGYKKCGVIKIFYSFHNGKQSQGHPNPGKVYRGTKRVAYLPDNEEGQKVHRLLRRAFQQRILFTIGSSRTTGKEDVVTWNDVHHKTRLDGGPARFGYPDPGYISRVLGELAAKGITEG